ncbi:hypothetical protein BAUCODRAFT_35422 [Baudoinia panamericana UAMH 10762]|uniref:Calcineurin-like phosphoesterase domain-containing protein n=1 Tax=Baudoinia panamericana (strain UAMH 10762) TaxID=717646 RepID=M2MFL5_BAUPA|nr:uncharacterized protein BAUCODRAFT_35422 [Baudoinia panamericana UAMH 10762]EMC95441.1 hypothetical protein BAUCODRAFT_35422 [Baudoinia panamericana UAMH 10762]
MHLRHAAQQHLRRLARRYPLLRRVSVTTSLFTLVWLYVVYWGERTTFAEHIRTCAWDRWEEWPSDASPHHMVLIADPQLVDPHTYPGRPWPLSALTERYTDLYMARNFRLTNDRLDPDSVVFLGDLFDGGREWAPQKARPLNRHQREYLENKGIVRPKDGEAQQDAKDFLHGEEGRWKAWDQRLWDAEFVRFGHIFFDTKQLYPDTARETFAAFEVPAHEVSVENGARNASSQEYAVAGGKQRQVIASLPGNHDLGFGAGVQQSVRSRFQMHFGDTNRIDIIGNHTFISLDAPSLSAFSQYVPEGGETLPERAKELSPTWKPTVDFLENLRTPAGKAVAEALGSYYPTSQDIPRYPHAVIEPGDLTNHPSTAELAKDALSAKAQLPVILLTHVPLYRDPDTDCGPLREKGHAIAISAGYQYQNVITQPLTTKVVNAVSAAGVITHVFSGDDHDYCDIVHHYNIGQPDVANNDGSRTPILRTIKEITVKSFSWAMGVRSPGFLLVSLWNPVDAEGNTMGSSMRTVQTHLCLLPDQLTIFIDYAMLLGFTLAFLLLRAVTISVRAAGNPEELRDSSPTTNKLILPRYKARANGYSTPTKANGRHRASSSSMSSGQNSSSSLGVQRSYNARTRSVSPAVTNGYVLPQLPEHQGPLIEKAGFYPQVRWADPADDSDEENHIGDLDAECDSQAKWKRRRRVPLTLRRTAVEFLLSVFVVGLPAGVWYGWLISNG